MKEDDRNASDSSEKERVQRRRIHAASDDTDADV